MLKYKNFLRTVALLLSVILVVVSLPATVLAVEPEETQETVIIDGETYIPQVFEWQSEEKIHAVQEIVSLREENVKHFSLPNGTYEAVAYASAVHRLDESGNWQDIDNTLTPTAVNGKTMLQTADGRVSLPATFSATEPVLSLWEDGYGIAMYFASASSGNGMGQITTSPMAEATVQNALPRPEGFDTLEEAIAVDNKTSVTYASVLPQTDLQYVLRGNDVKENIIIRSPAASYEYTFLLRLSGLAATLEGSGSISLRDAETNEEKAMIPAPFMYDASGNRSYDVSYTLVSGGDGLYALTVSADEAWINEDGRAFPVTVDPFIDWSDNYAYAYDTYISENAINTNYGAEDDVKVSPHDIALILVELPELPEGSVIGSGRIYLSYYATASSGATSGTVTVRTHQMLEHWRERYVTWNTASDWDNFGMATEFTSNSFTMVSAYSATNRASGWLTVTDIAKEWYDGGDNHGVAVEYYSGTMDTLYFSSYESGEAYAYLRVGYVHHVPDGVYAIKNPSTASWMTVAGTTTAANSAIRRQSYSTAPEISFTRKALFKISFVGGGQLGRYVIRCMTNNNLGLGIDANGNVVTKELPTNDADVPLADTFWIEWEDEFYYFRPYDTEQFLATSSSSILLTTVADTSTSDLAKWKIERYDGNQTLGADLISHSDFSNAGVIVGKEYALHLNHYWSTYTGDYSYRLTVASTDAPYVTSAWSATTNNLGVIVQTPGSLNIQLKLVSNTNNSTIEHAVATYQAVPVAGTYYFQNVGTKRYMNVEGSSSTSGAAIEQWNFQTENQEKWLIQHVANSGGYVRIKSAYSNLYLGINSSSTTSVRQYSTLNNYTLWKFERSETGNLQLICKSTEASEIVLAIPTTANANGTNLTQYADASNTTNRDEWELYQCVYTLNTTHYIDQGYVVRFATNNAEAISIIQSYQNEAAEYFLHNFQLEIIPQYTVMQSLADTCKMDTYGEISTSNLSAPCSHQTSHLTSSVLRNSYNDGTPTNAVIIWTGHILDGGYRSGSLSNRNSIVITPWFIPANDSSYPNNPSEDVVDESIFDLTHELMHQVGAKDHYCAQNGNPCSNIFCDICQEHMARPRTCIMSDRAEYSFCSDCSERIFSHLNLHHEKD